MGDGAGPIDGTDQHCRYSGRIGGLDIARGLAVLGMFYAHVAPWENLQETSGKGSVPGILAELPNGRSAILFALVAGVSLAILTGRNVPYTGETMRTARLRIFGRACALLVLAAPLEALATDIIIILGYYAAWFVAALPFTSWSARKLLTAAAIFSVAGPVGINIVDWCMGNMGLVDSYVTTVLISGTYPGFVYMAFILAGMGIGRLDLSSRTIQRSILAAGCALAFLGYGTSWALTHALTQSPATSPAGGSAATCAVTPTSQTTSAQATGLACPAAPAEPTSRTPSSTESSLTDSSGARNSPTPSDSSSGPSSSGLSSASPGSEPTAAYSNPSDSHPPLMWLGEPFPPGLSFVTAAEHSNTAFEAIGSGGFAMAVLGLSLLIGRLSRTILYPLAAVGSMPLTSYMGSVVAIALNRDWIDQTVSWGPWLRLTAGTLIFCAILKPFVQRGPFEWLLWKASMAAAHIPRS